MCKLFNLYTKYKLVCKNISIDNAYIGIGKILNDKMPEYNPKNAAITNAKSENNTEIVQVSRAIAACLSKLDNIESEIAKNRQQLIIYNAKMDCITTELDILKKTANTTTNTTPSFPSISDIARQHDNSGQIKMINFQLENLNSNMRSISSSMSSIQTYIAIRNK